MILKMQPHSKPHVHLHIEIDKDTYEQLKKLHPGYGEISGVIRRLVASYVQALVAGGKRG